MIDPAAAIAELSAQIRHHDHRYHTDASPEISDADYDALMRQLVELEAAHPELAAPDSPTRRVGGDVVDSLVSVAHRVPMLSIDNTYSQAELRESLARMVKTLAEDPATAGQRPAWVMEYKIDGVAGSIRYENGELVLGLTRGNGVVGDDITHNVRTIRDVPPRLIGEAVPAVLEVRGEIYMTEEDLADLNVRQAAAGGEAYKNTRNVTAGTVRLLDPAIAADRRLRFLCHGVGETVGVTAKTHMEFLAAVGRWGIRPTPDAVRLESIDAVIDAVTQLEQQMPPLPFEVDGIVFKIDDLAMREVLGVRSKSPRWVIAYKFERYEGATRLLGIDVQVGKTGTITPVALLEPVEIAGTTVSRASLHNADEIERLDVRVGDHVIVEKAGKIIPKVIRVAKELRTAELPKFEYPATCPQCGGELVRDKGGVYIRCVNPACPAQLRGRLIYYGSRPGMDIDGLGEEVVDLLIAKRLVASYADLYRLDADQLADLTWPKKRKGKEGEMTVVVFGRKNAQTLVGGIEASKTRGLARVLASISIRHVGPRVARLITAEFWTLEKLRSATIEQIAAVHEIGQRIAESLHAFLHSEVGRRTMDDLRSVGVVLAEPEPRPVDQIDDADRPLAGKTVVVTGTLQHYKRDGIKSLIEKLGGRAAATVSSKTDFLVAGAKAGSKRDKAERLGIEVIDEAAFRDRFDSDSP